MSIQIKYALLAKGYVCHDEQTRCPRVAKAQDYSSVELPNSFDIVDGLNETFR